MEGENEDILNHRWQLRGSFNQQVAEILITIRMSRLEVEGIQILYDDIQSTFGKIWQGCHVKAFGSIVTGLALKGSDVDCYLELPANCGDSPTICIQKSKDLIDNSISPFQQASTIEKKVPIVQFYHAETGIRCDLSFNRPIAVEFGKLVGYLLSMDDRVLKLAVLIKYWAKCHQLTGTKLFPSNALIILIIFFLQLKKILPSVAALQKACPANMIDGWNTAFGEITYTSSNVQSVYNLLGEFFVCYSNFDFRNLIICPYLGEPIERQKFLDVFNVPPAFRLYKDNLNNAVCEQIWLNCLICVQDPFDHARNCAGPVKPQLGGWIIQHFKTAVEIYGTTPKCSVLSHILSPYKLSKPRINKPSKPSKNFASARINK